MIKKTQEDSKMRALLVSIVLLVAGCAGQVLNEGLPYLLGKPIHSAVNVLGLPSSRTVMGSYTIYEWTNAHSGTVPISTPNTSYTSGHIGGTALNASTTSYSTNYIPVNYVCSIKLAVDSNEVIQRWEFRGNQGGCQYYANGVKTLIP